MASEKYLKGRFQQRFDTEENWKKAKNFVPLEGEIIVYSDLNKIKIGDGETLVNDLGFLAGGFGLVSEDVEGNTVYLGSRESLEDGGTEGGAHLEMGFDGSITTGDIYLGGTLSGENAITINDDAIITGNLIVGEIDKNNNELVGESFVRTNKLCTNFLEIGDAPIGLKLTSNSIAFKNHDEAKFSIEGTPSGVYKDFPSGTKPEDFFVVQETVETIKSDDNEIDLGDLVKHKLYLEGDAEITGKLVIGTGEATGTGAIVLGSGTASGDYSFAEGADTLAGCMGYYITAIDTANRQIYLHTGDTSVIPTWENPSSYYDETFESGYQVYKGDVNSDGILDMEDYNDILKYCAQYTLEYFQPEVSDINGDGNVEPMDATLIMQHLSGENVPQLKDFTPFCNEFSIGSDAYYHWPFAGQIVEISGNRITYSKRNSLDTTEKWLSNVNNGADPMIFFVPAQPDCGLTTVGLGSHAEGYKAHAAGQHSHAEGCATLTGARYGHAEGRNSKAGFAAHAEGQGTLAKGLYSHAEGANTQALASGAHAEGTASVANKTNAHAEGSSTTALGQSSHIEGRSSNKALDIIPDLSESSSYDDIKSVWDNSDKGFSAVLGDAAHAEGLNTIAKKQGHAEGYRTISWGDASHSEGYKTSALGKYSHVEGTENIANGIASHAEGIGTIANGKAQHVEGRYNIKDTAIDKDGYGKYAHIVGYGKGPSDKERGNAYTLDWNGNAYFAGQIMSCDIDVDGDLKVTGRVDCYDLRADSNLTVLGNIETVGSIECSALNVNAHTNFYSDISVNDGDVVIATDYTLIADDIKNHNGNYYATVDNLIGKKTAENGEIFNNYGSNKAEGNYAHAEGSVTTAGGDASHAEGLRTTALGIYSHAEGRATNKATDAITDLTSSKKYSDYTIKGKDTLKEAWDKTKFSLAIGECAHSEGVNTIAGSYAHAEGEQTIASGNKSHAEGTKTQAKGLSSHSEGEGTIVNKRCQHVQGKYNIEDTSSNTYGKYAHIVGNGDSTTPSNAHTLDWNGNAWFQGVITTVGADYAEFFEWVDGNTSNEDRIGYLVSLEGDKIKLASQGDEILGVVSGTAAILGDNSGDTWQKKYLTDNFGRIIYDMVEDFYIEIDSETKEEVKISNGFYPRPRINPDFDSSRPYLSREQRPEWDKIGMLGKLYARDDGTCVPNGYATIGTTGILTNSLTPTNVRVMKRTSNNIVWVLLK